MRIDLPRILILVPYFGPWPEWIECFLATCRWNRSIDWLFIGDFGPPGRLAPNLRYRRMTFPDFVRLAEERLSIGLNVPRPYKICDLRLAFGTIFSEYLDSYDFFGWGDIDVLYGNLRRFLTAETLDNDVITFNNEHLSGHFTLIRNGPQSRTLHLALPDFLEKVAAPDYQHLDEPLPSALEGFRVSAKESFNTPLSILIPWRDGRFVFPSEWYWRAGSLTNDLDKDVEFLYLHFMHWKGGDWPRECGNAQWERYTSVLNIDPSTADKGFRVNERGIFRL